MNRFILQKSEKEEYDWVCTDMLNYIVCEFKDGKFNETQNMRMIEDIKVSDTSVLYVAKLMREMGDWLSKNHYEKLF